MVVGRVVPIAVEGGGERKGYASWRSNHAKPFIRRRSSSLGLKQISRKGSRSNLISVQVQIQLEGQGEEGNDSDDKENALAESSAGGKGKLDKLEKLEKKSSLGRLPLRVVPTPSRRPVNTSPASTPPILTRRQSSTLTRRASINKLLAAKPKNQLREEVNPDKLATQIQAQGNPATKLATNSRRISLENLEKSSAVTKPAFGTVTQPTFNTIHMTLKQPVTIVETVFESDTDNQTEKSSSSGRRTNTKKDDVVNHTDQKDILQNVTVHFNTKERERNDTQYISPIDGQRQASKFEIELLEGHNKCRAKHGVKPLQLDKKLSEYSQKWAEKLARLDILEHSGSHQYGENLYCAWNSDPAWTLKGEEAVYSWYSEVEQHKYGRKARNPETGHFTQVIWKNSLDLGIGLAKSKSGKMIVVCNYSPAGNFIGQYKENVPKAIHTNNKENEPKTSNKDDNH